MNESSFFEKLEAIRQESRCPCLKSHMTTWKLLQRFSSSSKLQEKVFGSYTWPPWSSYVLFFYSKQTEICPACTRVHWQDDELQHSDSAVWKALTEGNFCVKKSSIPFTSLGVDQALEQENRKIKVLGGLSGLTCKSAALARFFLVVPERYRLLSEADNLVGVSSGIPRQQLRCVIELTNPFQYEGTDLVNLVSKSVLPEEIKADVLHQYDAGKEAHTAFVKERIVETVICGVQCRKLN